jgi:hypothetical protein
MNRTTLTKITVLLLLAIGLAAIPSSRDEIHWLFASYKNDYVSYESYLKKWLDGRHAVEAQRRYDESGWANTKETNTVQAFERYIQLHGENKLVGEAKGYIDQLYWKEAIIANTIQGFERYIQLNGDGKHVAEAKDNIDSLHWQEATAANNVQGFERYVQMHGDGKHVANAKDNIDSLHWQEATTANTIRAYRNYVTKHPEGPHLREAEAKAASLRKDDAPFRAALLAGTEAALRQFVAEFPGHQKEQDALPAIKEIAEGRDIVDLLKEKKIEIETHGRGIQNVGVRIRKLVPYPITVRFPVGSYFVSSRQSAQNMVTTEESKVRITGDDWQMVSVHAACANRPRDIPGSKDTFTVQRSPHQKELEQLMPILDRAGVNFATRQAAVWIVTDNASYSDLGILVQLLSGTRTIGETETARAMKICTGAGIDITRKRIWIDRQKILKGLGDGELKKWLQEKQ